ncbi:MAG: hypothetical protein RIT81_27590 [Deltaproteobacteria bacterium]
MGDVWVTGFEPFEGVPENRSALAVERLEDDLADHRLRTAVLPVDTDAVGPALETIYASAPVAVLHVGVAEREAICVERTAVNRRRFRVPDNAGRVLQDMPVIEGAPEELSSRLDVQAIQRALVEDGHVARISDDAGTYLCNQTMFTSLYRLPASVPTGFLHVPVRADVERIVAAIRRVLTITLCLVALFASPAEAKELPFMKGMTVSCPGYGRVWGAPPMQASLEELRGLGVEWVAIHPYARVRRDGSIQYTPAEETGYLGGAVKIAAAEKMKLFWKPHLAYWGSFEWRGAITFDSEAEWKRFFASYERWIVDQARFAAKHRVPVFAVGTEYKATSGREASWRKIIAAVRKVYDGQITYAANWDEYRAVKFWDAVDLIGVQAYFPVGDEQPTKRAIDAAWDQHLLDLAHLSRTTKRPVVFTELGYPRSTHAAAEPWKPATDGSTSAIALRTMLMDSALERIAKAPHVRGVFWWKWLPSGSFFQSDFSMRDDEAREVLKRRWGAKPTTPRPRGSSPASR